jgi:hypothetical protein
VIDAQSAETAVEGGPADPKQLGGLGTVSSGLPQRQEQSFLLTQVRAILCRRGWAGTVAFGGKIGGLNDRAGAVDTGKLDGTLELPHVSGPGVGPQNPHGLVAYGVDGFARHRMGLSEELGYQKRNVLAPFAQGRELNAGDPNPIEQVGAKAARFNILVQNSLS